MKSLAAAALILLATSFAIPARAQEHRPAGSLMRAVHRESGRLVAADESGVPGSRRENRAKGWSRVTRLAPGTKIFVEVHDAPAAPHVFVRADELELIVLKLGDPPLDIAVRRVLQETAASHPEYFVQAFAGLRFVHDNVHVGPDGVFVVDRKVAALSGVVRRIPRTEISAIKEPPRRRGSLLGAAIGAGGGFILGFASATRLAYTQCNGSCSDEQALMVLSLVGLPIAGGLLGYQANAHMSQEVVYRR